MPPFCGHIPGSPQQCEQWKPCQLAPDFYMSLPGHFTDHRCDSASDDVTAGESFWCHHKPEGPAGASGKGAQVGPTTVCAVPFGDPPRSSRGRCITTEVRP
jgi:hypothetical protein